MPEQVIRYVAFLRGINVGGHGIIKMADVKAVFESLKFKNVKTVLASGNVLFETTGTDANALTLRIEKQITKELGKEIGIVVRTIDYLEEIAASQPFKSVKVTPDTRLYVTFLREKPNSRLKIPYKSDDLSFEILKLKNGEIYSVLTLQKNGQTGTAMNIIEKEFGKQVTTRNWNTIEKILSV